MSGKKKYRILRGLLRTLGIIMALVMVLLILLNIPVVQTKLATTASEKFSEKINFKITIDKVRISWFDQVVLKDLSVRDEDSLLLFGADELQINYDLIALIREELRLNSALVSNLNFNLAYHSSDTLNITVFVNRLKALSSNSSGTKSTNFTVDHIELENSSFHYQVDNSPLVSERFNYKNFNLDDINGYVSNLAIRPDTFLLKVNDLSARDIGTGSTISHLKTTYLISSQTMQFDELELSLNESNLRGYLDFKYDSYAAFSDFVNEVETTTLIEQSMIRSKDLRLYAGFFDKIRDQYKLRGEYRGTVSDFKVRKLDLLFGSGSHVIGSLDLEGLPAIFETFMYINLKTSRIYENDLVQYIPSESFAEFNRFNEVLANGSFTGYVDDFVARGRFDTNLGTIISDINLKINSAPENSSYSGKIKLVDFNLKEYTATPLLGNISLDGSIKGQGLSPEKADFTFNGKISALDLNNYTYTGIATNGRFINEYFNGNLSIDDPNIKLQTTAEIDLRNAKQKVSINGELDYAHPDKLNLLKDINLIRTRINADIQGLVLDSINGTLFLENIHAENKQERLNIEHLTFSSFLKDSLRQVELLTDRANVKVSGDFSYQEVARDIQYMIEEYKFSLLNAADSLRQLYQENQKIGQGSDYKVDIEARFGNIDSFLNLFFPQISLHSNTKIAAHYDRSHRNVIAAQIINDSLTVNDIVFVNNLVNVDASKVIGRNAILAAADVQSQQQITGTGRLLEDLVVSAVWSNEHIDFTWHNTYPELRNSNDIYGAIDFFSDSTQIHLNKSQIDILDEIWTIKDNNLITIHDREIKISNLNLGSNKQMITANGVISPDQNENLAVTVNSFDLNLLNTLLPQKLSGFVSGEFTLNNLYGRPTVVSNFYVSNLYIDKFLVGDIFSSNDWNNDRNLFDIQFLVNRNNTPIIHVNGVFNPFDPENALDLHANFMNAKLNIVEPFVSSLFSNIKGNINGRVHVTGPLQAPSLDGVGTIHRAGLKVNYLNTAYEAAGQWALDRQKITLKNILLTDSNNKSGVLNGEFTHNDFKNFNINLQGSMNEFLVLNTTARDNDLFYGTGIATGTVDFTGPIEDITIRAQAKTERGTRFYIPIGSSESSEFEDFISFVDFSDTLAVKNSNNEDEGVKITGLNLQFELDITEDAYSEIIFDITSGDIIRGRGNGHISMNINTQGEFTMLGNYEFVSGGYNFTMYNIVNKEFSINPKSRITWTGDPYGGIMDIDATYAVNTSFSPLVDSVYQDLPDVKRIYPVEVLLGLSGPLLTPDITFEIIIDDYPKSNTELDTQIKAFLNTVALDQQELNRQVFSLLILRKFSPLNSFNSSVSIGSSVSEFVSNQLSYWISQVDENLTIDMDLSNLDSEALKAFQLRISYEFMDGKLVVTRDGGFTDPNNEASVESIAGDWTLEYLLSEDGRLRVKLFNKTNYNQFNSTTGSDNQALISGGFSLIYTTSFNSFSELFNRKKPKENKKEINNNTSALKPDDNQELKPQN